MSKMFRGKFGLSFWEIVFAHFSDQILIKNLNFDHNVFLDVMSRCLFVTFGKGKH